MFAVGISLGFLLAMQVGPEPSQGPDLTRFEFRQTHMGSEFKLVLYTRSEDGARVASAAAFARVAQLDAILSDYDPQSELMRLCDRAGEPPVPVSEDLFKVLERAQRLAQRTQGAFDVTIQPVVRLWRRARRRQELPEPDRLRQALRLVGYKHLRLNPETQTVQLLKAGMRLDLGGIAKGYAADEAQEVLKRHGIRRALVAAAGDIVVSDPPPGAPGWTIGIGPLENPAAQPSRFLQIRNAAVSTSGDAERFVEIDGKRYAHIVDPRTGLGVIDRSSVTVVAPDGTASDSLATAVYLLGPERGLKLIEQTKGAAALIVRKTDDGTQVLESRRFGDLCEAHPDSGTDTQTTYPLISLDPNQKARPEGPHPLHLAQIAI